MFFHDNLRDSDSMLAAHDTVQAADTVQSNLSNYVGPYPMPTSNSLVTI